VHVSLIQTVLQIRRAWNEGEQIGDLDLATERGAPSPARSRPRDDAKRQIGRR